MWWWMSSAEQQEAGLGVGAELLNRLCLLEQQGRRRGVTGAAESDQAHMGGVWKPLDQQLLWTHAGWLKPQRGW